MYITILSLGSLKQSGLRELASQYIKRLSPYGKLEEIELKEIAFSPKDPIERIKREEADLLQKHLTQRSTIIALHETGTQLDSISFAKFLEDQTNQGQHITFVIGGPVGLHESILQKANYTLSLSPLTFTHQFARVLLLEQLYRAQTILRGKTYHY